MTPGFFIIGYLVACLNLLCALNMFKEFKVVYVLNVLVSLCICYMLWS